MFRQRENFVRNIELKHLEAEGKMIPTQTLSEGKILSKFTESGALALSILALFDIARHFIKVENIKAYSSGKNQRELALLDAIEENKSHLFAFLEQLPDNERNTAFAYIAENYFDDFQNQTQNLLYALAVLENKGLPGYAPENIQQKVSDKFDQSYLNMEKKLQQIDLNI